MPANPVAYFTVLLKHSKNSAFLYILNYCPLKPFPPRAIAREMDGGVDPPRVLQRLWKAPGHFSRLRITEARDQSYLRVEVESASGCVMPNVLTKNCNGFFLHWA